MTETQRVHAHFHLYKRIIGYSNLSHEVFGVLFALMILFQPAFGICFDIDGVIARGSVPIPEAIKAFHRLVDDRGLTRLPVAFVTNSLNRNVDRAKQLSTMLGVQVWNAYTYFIEI